MIPRHIAEHVKGHNWFAVAIDFFIVVGRVFVATQVDNWNARGRRVVTSCPPPACPLLPPAALAGRGHLVSNARNLCPEQSHG
jgi:hypothetical protein